MAGGVEEVKDRSVPTRFFRIFVFFPVRVCVHGPGEFQEKNLFALGIDGVPVWSQLKESFHCVIHLALSFLAEDGAIHLEAGETEHSQHVWRVWLRDVEDLRVFLVGQMGVFDLELGRVVVQKLAHFSLEILPV